MKPWRFYVYIHRRADTGEPFYVGKGAEGRAWNRTGRTAWWKNRFRLHGLTVEIFAYYRTEADAFEAEKQLITELGKKHSLVNICSGGKGGRANEVFDEESARLGVARHKRRNHMRQWRRRLDKATATELNEIRRELGKARPDDLEKHMDREMRRLLSIAERKLGIDRPYLSSWNRLSHAEQQAVIQRRRCHKSGDVRQ